MVTHSSILAWRIPQTEDPSGLQNMGLQRVGHDWVHTLTYTPHTYPTEYPTHVYWKITCNNLEGTVFYRGKTLQTIEKSNKCKTDNYIMEYLLRWKWI